LDSTQPYSIRLKQTKHLCKIQLRRKISNFKITNYDHTVLFQVLKRQPKKNGC
jgi:hypothetical protein